LEPDVEVKLSGERPATTHLSVLSGTSDDDELETSAALQHCYGAQQNVKPLDSVHAPDEQHDLTIRIEPQARPCCQSVARPKEAKIDTAIDNRDPLPPSPVLLHQRLPLVLARRDDAVSGCHHVLFDADPG